MINMNHSDSPIFTIYMYINIHVHKYQNLQDPNICTSKLDFSNHLSSVDSALIFFTLTNYMSNFEHFHSLISVKLDLLTLLSILYFLSTAPCFLLIVFSSFIMKSAADIQWHPPTHTHTLPLKLQGHFINCT